MQEESHTIDTLFEEHINYTQKLQKINHIENVFFHFKSSTILKKTSAPERQGLMNGIKEKISAIRGALESWKDSAVLNKLSGPVNYNLQVILNPHHIQVQAHHNSSFTGNHYNKYLWDHVYKALSKVIIIII